MQSSKISALIVGATGQLGSLITKHCLKQNGLQVNILVRNPDKDKELTKAVTQAGGKVLKGDVNDHSTLKGVTQGIHTVISALIGDDATVLDGQRALLKDGLENGVKRFVPSDFSLDYKKLQKDEHALLKQRIQFREELEKTNVKGLHVFNGVFMETFFTIVDKDGFWYWGDPNRKINLISMHDVARFVAQAVRDPNLCGDVMVTSEEISIKELRETYNHITGRNEELKNMGTLSDLRDCIKKFKQEGDLHSALKLGYFYLIFGEDTLIKDWMNNKFPMVKSMTVEEYLGQTKGKPENDLPLFEIAKNVPKERLLEFSV
jgi:nucleoside-diphosphate-sugar epimerase